MSKQVSVIVAAYNVENYIENAIRSALAQEGVTVEVILVDDCSKDATWVTASKIDDPRLKLMKLERNSGAGAARNAGFAAARYPWIAVLDGDDTFEPMRLARLIERAEVTHADIVVDNMLAVHEADGKTLAMFAFDGGQTLDLPTFIRNNCMFQSDYSLGYLKPVFAAAFLSKHNLKYDTGLPIGEDYLMVAEALACGARCTIESQTGYRYLVRKGSTSHRLSLENIDKMIAADQKFQQTYRLDASALQAQGLREKSLRKARAYNQLVEAIKCRDIGRVVTILKTQPSAALPLWEPVWVRVKRFGKSRQS